MGYPKASRECSCFCRCPSAQALVPECPAPQPCSQEASASFHTSLRHQKQKPQPCPLQAQPTHTRPDPILGPAEPQPCPLVGQHKPWDTPDPVASCVRKWPVYQQTHTSSRIPRALRPELWELDLPTSEPARAPVTPGPRLHPPAVQQQLWGP